jgi:hypothetical protein
MGAEQDLRVRRRDDLSKHDTIHVIVRYGVDGQMIKRKRARVIDVLRKAAVCSVDGENQTRTIRFSDLELMPPPPPPPSEKSEKPKRRTSRRKKRAPEAEAVADTVETAVVPPPPAEPTPPAPKSEPPSMSDWLANGVKLQEQLIQQAHDIENEVLALQEKQQEHEREALRFSEKAGEKTKALEAVRAQIELMDTLRGIS